MPKKNNGVPGENTGVSTSDEGENKRELSTERIDENDMYAIDSEIDEVVTTLDQGIREANTDPE